MAMTIVESTRLVTGGVDTHLDVHVAAAVDANGGTLTRRITPWSSGRSADPWNRPHDWSLN